MKKVFFGIIIIAAGVLLMLHNIGILPDSIFRTLFNWQVLLIAIGLVNVFQKESRVLGVILISVGSFFLLLCQNRFQSFRTGRGGHYHFRSRQRRRKNL